MHKETRLMSPVVLCNTSCGYRHTSAVSNTPFILCRVTKKSESLSMHEVMIGYVECIRAKCPTDTTRLSCDVWKKID